MLLVSERTSRLPACLYCGSQYSEIWRVGLITVTADYAHCATL